MIIHNNTNNHNLETTNDGKIFTQRFLPNKQNFTVLGRVFNVMINMSTQFINNQNIIEKDILNYCVWIDEKDMNMTFYIDIDYYSNNYVLNNLELQNEIENQIFVKANEKIKEIKELKRKEQKAYFAKKNAILKAEKKKQQILKGA